MLAEKIQLETDETILFQIRKHWFILFTQLFGLFLAGFFPLIGLLIIDSIVVRGFTESVHYSVPLIVALYAAWLILIWMAVFNIWTNYYLDVWTLTNKRLIAVDQKGLFHRSTSSFRLERLQDMNVEINGIIATLLDFGTLHAKTAGKGEEDFKAHGLPTPRELKAEILVATDALMREYSRVSIAKEIV